MSKETTPEHHERYVAFCDILGFSAKVSDDFEKTLSIYKKFTDQVDDIINPKDISITIYSDAILITSEKLLPVLQACQILNWVALTNDMLLRGGVSFGKYWEEKRGRHLCVVSDGLIKAVKIESTVGHPAVKIDDDIEIPLGYWAIRMEKGPFLTPILHHDGMSIVSPFTQYWGLSAGTRAKALMDESHDEHKCKYEWFIGLYEAAKNDALLIPEHAFNEFIEIGAIVYTPPRSESLEN